MKQNLLQIKECCFLGYDAWAYVCDQANANMWRVKYKFLGLKIVENFSHILCCTPQIVTGVILHAYLTITMTFLRWHLSSVPKVAIVERLYCISFILRLYILLGYFSFHLNHPVQSKIMRAKNTSRTVSSALVNTISTWWLLNWLTSSRSHLFW